MRDDVVLLEAGALHALAAAFLAPVEIRLGALGVSGFGDGDDDVLAGDQVLVADVSVGRDDSGATVVAVFVDDLFEFVAHDRALPLRFGQDVFQVGDFGFDLGQVIDDPLALEGRQAAQLHVQDGLRLDVVDVKELDQSGAGDVDCFRRPDQRDDLVQRVQRLDQTAQDVGPYVGLAQPVGGAPNDDVELVRDVVTDHLVQAQRARHPVDNGQHVGAETGLQLGVLVEVIEHHLGHRVALELDDDAHTHPVAALVFDVGDAGQPAVADLLGDRGDEVVVVDLIRQLGDDQRRSAPGLFDLHHAAHPDGAAAGLVGVGDALASDNQSGGGEVGALDPFAHGGQGGFLVGLVVFEAPEHRLGQLPQVVRRDVGRHADRDAARTIGQQVGEPAGQHRRLLHPTVVVGYEIDCLLVDFAQHLHRQRRQACLCIVADEPVRQERVVVGVDPQAIHRLDTGLGYGGDFGVVEAAIGEVGRDGTYVWIGDVCQDLAAAGPPALDSVNIMAIEPITVGPGPT